MKICRKCEVPKPLNNFPQEKNGRHIARCMDCTREDARARYKANAEVRKKRSSEYRTKRRKSDPDAVKAIERRASAKYRETHREEARAITRTWKTKNAARVNETVARRRMEETRATPKWANLDKVKEFYEAATEYRKRTGEAASVDHIVPVKSDLVCGLHNEFNLRVVLGSFNSRKRNHTWPDMPDKNEK